jgi:hypothetical protein
LSRREVEQQQSLVADPRQPFDAQSCDWRHFAEFAQVMDRRYGQYPPPAFRSQE